jgi:two-component system chemotaxis sensor kinase CheA
MAGTGDEEEFRVLFAQEAAMRLARLGEQLLALEEAGSDEELIASVFREAHTLKGAAAVVGIDDVSRVAHVMEDVLEQLRSGERLASPELIDALLGGVDGLTEMIPALLAGEDRSATADAIEAKLRTALRTDPAGSDPAVEAGAAANGEHPEGPEEADEDPKPALPATRPPGTTPAAEGDGPAVHRPSRPDGETVMVPVGRLDELVRLVGESAAAHLRIGRMLGERLSVDPGTVSEFRDLSLVLNDLQERTMRARMVPVATVTDQLHRTVRDLARAQGKEVHWEVRGEETELDRGVLQQLADPLLHMVRNAVDHGIETPAERAAAGKPEQASIRLHAMQLGSEVIVAVTDDGRGIDVGRVREQAARAGADLSGLSDEETVYSIFRSGLSTARFVSDVSGRGVGLDVVRSSLEAVRGRVEVRSEPGAGCEFRIIVPITLAVLPCLLIAAGAQRYAIPMHSVVLAQFSSPATETHAEGRAVVWVGAEPVAVSSLPATLGLAVTADDRPQLPVVVLASVTRKHAFRVDALLGQRDVVVKGLGRLLPRLDVLAGASVEPDGSILLVLDAPGLIDRARQSRAPVRDSPDADHGGGGTPHRGALLVVDDALTVRELERSILERAGYVVRTAGDGVEALARLAEESADLVLTDVEMPRMDGFALTEAIRAHPALANVPVLILTSRTSEEDRQRGLEVGADGYIVKSAFDETALIGAVERLLGRRP